jgi:hypothetical protein
MQNLIGRVVAYDAEIHPIKTLGGPVYFENQGGLLYPLSAIPLTQMDGKSFPAGLFNFTIQGLSPGGSVTLTIIFPHPVTSGTEWLSKSKESWFMLPINQTSISGKNMTLTFTNADKTGVISVFGGPAYPAPYINYTSETSLSTLITTTSSSQNQNPTSTPVIAAAIVIVVLTLAVVIRKRGRKM